MTEWSGVVHEGRSLEWCVAIAFSQPSVVAVRSAPGPRGLGAAFFGEVVLNESHARVVVGRHGGSKAFTTLDGGPYDPIGTLSMRSRVPTIDLGAYEVDAQVLRLVPRELCELHCMLPVLLAGSSLIVAVADPYDHDALERVAAETLLKIEPVIATEVAIRAAIARYY